MTFATPPRRKASPAAGATEGDGVFLPSEHIVGESQHRSGWRYAIESLRPILGPYGSGLLLDDFVERTFLYDRPGRHDRHWIGIFHHPPDMPSWGLKGQRPQELLRLPEFRSSARNLVRAIALSEYAARFWREELGVAVDVVEHPTEAVEQLWTLEKWQANEQRGLVQIGWFLRNMRLAYQIPPGRGIRRTIIRLGVGDTFWNRDVDRYWRVRGDRREFPGVEELSRIPNESYDELLASNVIVAEFFDASANNLVVECIVRRTPLFCNRHPAVVEYLGEEYPLYFQHPNEIPARLDPFTLQKASEYLAGLDHSRFAGETFLAGVRRTVEAARKPGARYVA